MEIIHAKEDYRGQEIIEQSIVNDFIKFNMVLSEEGTPEANDFELVISSSMYKLSRIEINDWLYVPNTEWGGLVEGIEHINDEVRLTGSNFRGRVAKRMITPQPMENDKGDWVGTFYPYININGEANKVLEELYQLSYAKFGRGGELDQYAKISKQNTGITIRDKIRFENFLDITTRIFLKHNMRLSFVHTYNAEFLQLFEVSAKPVADYSSELFINNDYGIDISSIIDYSNRRTYCLCLWKGELEKRETHLLKMDRNGSVNSSDPFWDGPDYLSNCVFYDNPNAETMEELVNGGVKKLKEENNTISKIEFTFSGKDKEYYLGDKISAYDEITKISAVLRIVKKELTIDDNGERIEYTVSE